MAEYTWIPTRGYVEGARVSKFARSLGIGSIAALRERSANDIGWYWDAVVNDLGIPFSHPYEKVVDLSPGIEYPDWFVGGRFNVVDACLARWARDDTAADRPAIVHEAETGEVRVLTYRELRQQAARLAGGLQRLGIGKGDVVALFLPMIPEAVVACYAVAHLGAIIAPLFSGFAPSALAARIQDAEAKAVIVADGSIRRRRRIALQPLLNEALASCPTVAHVVVVGNLNEKPELTGSRDSSWTDMLSAEGDIVDVKPMASSDPFLLAYTSGTTGRPKGAVHTHAGFVVKTASEVAYSFDVGPGSVFSWITDMGWIMGPLSIIGTHANGATLLLYEGSVDVPDLTRTWRLIDRHKVTMLGMSPTMVRTLRSVTIEEIRACDLSSIHTIGSTGEPWDANSYDWLARDVFGEKVPIINFSGGTEVGGSFLAPYPVEPIRSCSLGGPSLGMDVDVLNDDGQSVRGVVGELVCRQPWPSMTRGIWHDDARYREAYWSKFPGVWCHGDLALVDDGQWFLLGRSDDVMNIAGKRLAPAEVEAIITSHPSVAEAAAVGVPDPDKGEALAVFWVPRPDITEDVSSDLRDLVVAELGKPFAPKMVKRVPQLPKTRSAKVLRRAIRASALGREPGDLTGAENPEAVDEIRAIIESGE